MSISYCRLDKGSIVLHNSVTNTDTYENGFVIEHIRKVRLSSKRILLDIDEFLYIREHNNLLSVVSSYELIYTYIDELSYFSPRNNSCMLNLSFFKLPRY